MPESLENSKQIDRLVEFLATKGMKGYNNIENHLKIGRGFITKSKQGNGYISGGLLIIVAEMYPDLELRWLITGKGNMHVEEVRQSLTNETNQNLEIMNLTRLLTKTQQELIDKMKEVDSLKSQKTLSADATTPQLKPGDR